MRSGSRNLSDRQALVPLPVVVIVVAIAISLTVFGAVAIDHNAYQRGLAVNLLERQVELMEEAILVVDTVDAVIQCFRGTCP